MRFTRLLLLIVAATAIAGIAVPSAGALTFPDDVCPVAQGTVIKVCPQGEVGKPYSYQIVGRDGTGCVPYVEFRSIGTMPPGLSISSNGLISGTPTQTGEYVFYIEMRDVPSWEGGVYWCADDKSTEKQFSITIIQGLQIQQRQSVLTPGQLTVPYNLQFTASGGSATWAVTSGSLPAGLTLNSAGLLSGTPTTAGDYTFKVTATAGSRSDSQSYSMSVVPKLAIAPTQNAAEVGVPFRFTAQANGGKPGYTWSIDGTLPTGLTLDTATGAITGTPAAPGTFALKLTVKDSLGLTSTVAIPLTVAAQLLVTKASLPTAKVGRAYRATLRSTGGFAPRKWRAIGALPKGLKLTAGTGRITGTPKKKGTFRVRFTVTDKLGVHSSAGLVLTVAA
jgi:Putative Ig domain